MELTARQHEAIKAGRKAMRETIAKRYPFDLLRLLVVGIVGEFASIVRASSASKVLTAIINEELAGCGLEVVRKRRLAGGVSSRKMFRSRSISLKLSMMGAALLLIILHSRSASSEVPEGTWMFANRVAVQVFECSGQLCGRIIWLLRPRTPAGQPDLDTLNPDPSLRQRHLCGLTIIWGLQPGAQGHWTGGSLYDPQDGVTYDVEAELTTPTTMSARVYRGTPILGRTEILIRDPQLSFDGRC